MKRFPHLARLPEPTLLSTPDFSSLYGSIKTELLDALQEIAPADVSAVEETLNNNAEILTKFTQVFTVILQNHYRRWNENAKQMFGMYATQDDMVDTIAADMGLTRLVLEEGDLNAFPPVEPVMESNEQLLTRYYLSMFALATTGTRNGYRFHALTPGASPDMKIQSPDENTVVVTYRFEDHEFGGQAKDARFVNRAPGTGIVDGYLLAHAGDGTPSDELLAETLAYMRTHSVAQETDILYLHKASINRWTLDAVLYIPSGPDQDVIKDAADVAIAKYGQEQHRLEGGIERSMIDHVLLKATNGSGVRVQINSPASSFKCDHTGAPYLESVNIRVETE